MRLTEEQVRGRLVAAYCSSYFYARPLSERNAIDDWYAADDSDDEPRLHPAALRAVGVRWTGEHYEEVGG